ncbi:MAG: hypothetical protein ACFE0Q_10775 [Anaerolineae bacterium]
MTHIQNRWLNYALLLVGGAGILFNGVQIIIILAGGYNRNPAIEPDWLQSLDAIALTGLWLLASSILTAFAFNRLQSQR